MDKFVSEKTDRPAREPRLAGHRNGSKTTEHLFNYRQPIAHSLISDAVFRTAAALHHGSVDRPFFGNLAALDHLDAAALLPNDGPWIAPHERITPDVLPSLD